jgi:hypothetical protein
MKGMLNTLFAPIIVFKGWESALPDTLKEDIKISRMLNPDRQTATNEEAIGYLTTASLAAPLDRVHANVFLILSNVYIFKKTGQKPMPEYVRDMTDEELQALTRLRDWIFKTQEKHMAKRCG